LLSLAATSVDSEAEAIAELMLDVAQCFFKITGSWSECRAHYQIVRQLSDDMKARSGDRCS
jgi:hypothetical protein